MSRTEPREIEFMVLEYLEQMGGPIGSGQLADYLRQRGHTISEATVGRLLREMDHKQYTARTGFQGRGLTEQGAVRLEELRRRRALEDYSHELVDAVQATDLDQLVDVLVARRAIERETARLAAGRVTPADVAELEDYVCQYEDCGDPKEMARHDLAFHRKLAEMTGNRVFQAATRLVHQEAEGVPIPEHVTERMRRQLVGDHRRLFEAIRAGDPEQAETAMVQHIDAIIRAVGEHAVQTRRP